MRPPPRPTLLALCAALACTSPAPAKDAARAGAPNATAPNAAAPDANAHAGVDTLNARIARAYQRHDPAAYAALYTDSAVFEWPTLPPVRGRAALAAMARDNWAALRDMDLRLSVADRRVAPGHVTEFGAFAQTWRDSANARRAEYGRYVTVAVRGADGAWRMDRFLGFEDSTRALPAGR